MGAWKMKTTNAIIWGQYLFISFKCETTATVAFESARVKSKIMINVTRHMCGARGHYEDELEKCKGKQEKEKKKRKKRKDDIIRSGTHHSEP